jgi:3-methylcrotonyl-CoA carboxylase alpha subunit
MAHGRELRVLKRLLIANRGEIAVRIMHACREMGIESVAVHSDADARALHVGAADRAIAIGPAAAAESYLSVERIVEAARTSGADAIHPGYGFLSENPALAAACEQNGIVFVGPPSQVIATMGSKIAARRLMHEAGVPMVPGDTPHDQTDEGVRRAAERVGLPVLVKASAGGGGKGMRRIRYEADLVAEIQAARREAQSAFGDGTLYVERLIERPRHIEVQVMADAHGAVVHLFERDCSIQRRHQKVIEESPAPSLTTDLRAQITEAAVRAARAAGYRNAGTIEFLVENTGNARAPQFYFLEMNTRLQVEHPLTELVVGIDLVQAQLLVASGGRLPWAQSSLAQRGHAIEARVYAESPARGFMPQAGAVLLYREPHRPGVRIDAGISEGDQVTVHYDPLLAKVIAAAETREQAIDRLHAALRDFPILGLETNLPFLVAVLEQPEYRRADLHTGFIDEHLDTLMTASASPAVPDEVRAAFAVDDGEAYARQGRGGHSEWDPWAGPERTRR